MVTPMSSRKNKLSVGCKTPAAAANGPGRQQLAASAQMMVVMLSWPSFPQHAIPLARCGRERERKRSAPDTVKVLYTLNMFGPFFSPISHPELHPGFDLSTGKSTTIFLLRFFKLFHARDAMMEMLNKDN
jgi:hypothetical protein